VQYVGAKVSEDTRSVPLVAQLDNDEHLFKPGMFVWVSVPVEKPRETLAVRPAAVVHHEGQAFVFVPEGPETYRRVDVVTGLETSDWIEIQSGLEAGQAVVERGAALLKSELLLPTMEE
jgi:cobalt-zinc-cadmium efflux system membrane fusion protein